MDPWYGVGNQSVHAVGQGCDDRRVATRADGLTLEMTRVLPSPAVARLRLLQRSSQLLEVMGAGGLHHPPAWSSIPPSGDAYRIEMQPSEGEALFLTGEFRELDPRTRIAYTFR